MAISTSLLPEFDHEMATTRKTLERVPQNKFDWAPHPKSMTVVRLTSHMAHIPFWAVMTIGEDSLDLAASPPMAPVAGTAQALADFDKNVAAARAAIEACTDETWMKPWSLKMGDKILMTLPKVAVVRSWVMNHNVHHRAQMGVYLRLLDLPVPSVYGPSADEGQLD